MLRSIRSLPQCISLVAILAATMFGITSPSTGVSASSTDHQVQSVAPSASEDESHEGGLSEELLEQLTDIYRQKLALTPDQQKIDTHLLRVVRAVEERGKSRELSQFSTQQVRVDDSGRIELKLEVTGRTTAHLEQLEELGMEVTCHLPEYGVIEGTIPYDEVEHVAALEFVRQVTTPSYGIHNTGDVTSEGDAVLRASDARTAFGVDGSGVTVGVISDGVTHMSASVASGDLPSSPAVDVLQAGSGDEGTAMLEIVHDLAPGASLAFYGPTTSSNMVAGILALEAAGCDVIVDDLTFFNEPKFEDGPIAEKARDFVSNGGVYATSAGNSATRHYNADYQRDGTVTIVVAEVPYECYLHDYGSNDPDNTFTVAGGGSFTAILQWNNEWGLANDDFDFLLVDGDTLLSYSGELQDGSGNPYERIDWENTAGSAVDVSLLILEWNLTSEPSSLVLDYFVYASGFTLTMEYTVPEDSLIGHAALEEVFSTAATRAVTPTTIEYFSSRGPGTVYFPSHEERQVPNITGTDGVHTRTGQLGYFYDPFNGTSASAPHIAAVAALVWDADPSLTSAEVFDAITSSAVDLGPSGYDYTWGYGRVDAYAAVLSAFEPPSVSTAAVTLEDETTATLNGEITATGGIECDSRGFVWGTTSTGNPGDTSPEESDYDLSYTESGSFGTATFSRGITGLSQGTKYYTRACAHNDAGWSYGEESSFLTKPVAPTGFTAAANGSTRVTLSWTPGAGAQKTKVQRKAGSYPTDRDDGTEVFFDTGSGTTDVGLVPGTGYFYRAWSYVQGSEQWSDGYAEASATLPAYPPATVAVQSVTAAPGAVKPITITLDGVTDLGTAELTVTYDASIAELVSVDDGELGTVTHTNITDANTAGQVTFSCTSTASGVTGDFVHCVLNFEAVGANCSITALNPTVDTLTDYWDNEVGASITSGTFHILPLVEGDVTRDGVTNIVDAMFIAQYTVGIRELDADQLLCGDTTDDGETNIVDAMHIAQYTVDPTSSGGVLFKPLWDAFFDSALLEHLTCP